MTGRACREPDCGGMIDALDYCDTCGTKAASAPTPAAPGVPHSGDATSGPSARAGTPGAPPPVGSPCAEAGCGGRIDAAGYCDTCGTKAGPAVAAPPAGTDADRAGSPLDPTRSTAAALATSQRTSAFAGGSAQARGSRRVRPDSTRTRASRRQGIGGALVQVPTAPAVDPATIVMAEPEVAEQKRFCGSCGEPVGRSKGSRAGRRSGFCPSCRTPYDFVPKLAAGDLVAGQYRVEGPIAHGGLGWIYLARDEAVSGRWVVLKGLLNAGDDAAMAAAVAERRFLAQVQHPRIVEIYNFATHAGAGYTVMQFVGGPSLKAVLKQRRKAAGRPDPLPVEHAMAYVLAALPAFEYLHERGLLYCDFKPDNLIQVGDDVKLIDLGGVRRLDDPAGDIYGTVGFQAPEVPSEGVSVSSDVYTIGRTLAVLTMDFRGYTSTYKASLPDPFDHPALRDNEAFYRLLRKACAPHPDDRFQTVAELGDQLAGVLRLTVSARTGTPRPGPSTVFAGAPTGNDLPWLAVDPQDPAAAFLSHLPDDPNEALASIDEALLGGQLQDTVEVKLRRAWDLVEAGRGDEAAPVLAQVLADDPWEWRAVWVEGYRALEAGDAAAAAAAFDRCRSEVPGELGPLYAAGLAAEAAGDLTRAIGYLDLVSSVDPAWVAASFALARARTAVGLEAEAIAAYDRVPDTHRARGRAQRDAVRVLAASGDVAAAATRLAALGDDDPADVRVRAEVLQATLDQLVAGQLAPDRSLRIGAAALVEPDVRRDLEATYRRLALNAVGVDRVALVDRANAVRPRTLW